MIRFVVALLMLSSRSYALDSVAIQAMIDGATGDRNQGYGRVVIPPGVHVLNTGLIIRGGIKFGGEAPPGTTAGYHATLIYAGPNDQPAITVDGSGKDGTTLYAGTGGEISNLLILRRGQGGTGIMVRAKSPEQRPGEMVLRRLLIFGENGSQSWQRGIVIDGSASPGTNTSGVRRMQLDGCRVSHCSLDHYLFWSVVSMSATACQADPGGTVPRATVRFVGDNYDASWHGTVNGDVIIESAGICRNLSVSGKASQLQVLNLNATGVAVITSETAAVNQSVRFKAWVGGVP